MSPSKNSTGVNVQEFFTNYWDKFINKLYDGGSNDFEQKICTECNQQLNILDDWCKECNSKRFQQNFGKWTSGNEHINKIIQWSQLNANSWIEVLEWIPYDRLINIQYLAQGGFSTVYEGVWLDGWIMSWDCEKQYWKRFQADFKFKNPLICSEYCGYKVALKSLNNSSNINDEFLNEWKLYLQCQHEALSNHYPLLPLFGITQDPNTSNYMIVMPKMHLGNLKNNLLIKKYNPNDKFFNLFTISKQLESIHKLNLIHGDLHNGNLLPYDHATTFISDFGLCRPVDQPNGVYGVLPYIAPEVLRGKPYTKSADIYSLGIIMWEMTSGIPAYHNIPHELNLSLNICKGMRPEIIKGTMPEYVELMKRCWDNDPKKRPTVEELVIIFNKWDKEYPVLEDEKKRIHIPENEPKITYHPKSCYTSKKIDYSAKLNDLLSQGSRIIITDNDDDVRMVSENLDGYII